MNLFLVLYMAGAPVGLVPTSLERPACEHAAAVQQADFTSRGDGMFTVRCEQVGPNSMVWRLHPELRGDK